MAMKTLKYHRILPEVSVALLRDEETGKKLFRHRWRNKAKNVNATGRQEFKDYPFKSKRYKGIEEFEQFIKTTFEYD